MPEKYLRMEFRATTMATTVMMMVEGQNDMLVGGGLHAEHR